MTTQTVFQFFKNPSLITCVDIPSVIGPVLFNNFREYFWNKHYLIIMVIPLSLSSYLDIIEMLVKWLDFPHINSTANIQPGLDYK